VVISSPVPFTPAPQVSLRMLQKNKTGAAAAPPALPLPPPEEQRYEKPVALTATPIHSEDTPPGR
jgi:hypothetical protein